MPAFLKYPLRAPFIAPTQDIIEIFHYTSPRPSHGRQQQPEANLLPRYGHGRFVKIRRPQHNFHFTLEIIG